GSMKKIPKIYYMIPPAYSKGDKSDEKAFPDYTTMQDLITESCKKAATDNKASFIPIGLSFQALLKKYPDFFPNLYKEDGKTPSEVGSYMAACAVYGTIISGAPVVSIKWFGEVDPENAIEIRLIVKKVIDQHL
ncbi:MAG: hypothetical protein NE327_13075, partial [Lentisphaeraceae bacterium]|nr:hypothetical protein [Lentisphaeraceae bacterium]